MTLEQQQRVKTRTAEQSASIAAIEAERRREAESARILAERKIEEAEIERQQIVRTRQVEAEREVAIREIEQQQATEIASQARAIAVAANRKSSHRQKPGQVKHWLKPYRPSRMWKPPARLRRPTVPNRLP